MEDCSSPLSSASNWASEDRMQVPPFLGPQFPRLEDEGEGNT